jgi:hypothetical protein
MKPLFLLLCVWHMARVFLFAVPALVAEPLGPLSPLHLADAILFSLGLAASFELAFAKPVLPRLTPGHWRAIARLTLAAGALAAYAYAWGETLGLPDYLPHPTPWDLARIAAPYAAFAFPAWRRGRG